MIRRFYSPQFPQCEDITSFFHCYVVVSSFLPTKIIVGIMMGSRNIKALYSLFKRSRIPKKIVIGTSDEYIGSKNGLRTVAWKNGITHQALGYWLGEEV